MDKQKQEFQYRIHLLDRAMRKRLLGNIPRGLLQKLDIDEQASLLLGLLNSGGKND